MPGACAGREPQHAPLHRAGGYVRLGNAFLSLPLEPWREGRCQHRGTAGGTGCPAGSTLLSVPAPLLSSHLSRGSNQAVPFAPTGALLLPGQGVLWHYPCSLQLGGTSGCRKYTEHCCALGCFCFTLWMTNSTSGHAAKVKKQIFQCYLTLQDQEEPLRRVGKNCWCTSASLCKKHESER